MDHYEFNLSDLIKAYKKDKDLIPRGLIKLYAYQLIKAIGYLNIFHICHRDIKPKNILIDKNTHQLAICDFGSAKKLNPNSVKKNTTYICTRWYRAPELLFAVKNYSTKIDIWAAGCIIAEMLLRRPLFRGQTTTKQILLIFKVLGLPEKRLMKEVFHFELGQMEEEAFKSLGLENVLSNKDPELIDLLTKMLCYDPELRISAEEALQHKYFDEVWEDNLLVNGKKIPNLLDFTLSEIDGCDKLFPKISCDPETEKKSFNLEASPYKVFGEKYHGSVKNTGYVSTNMTSRKEMSPVGESTKDL